MVAQVSLMARSMARFVSRLWKRLVRHPPSLPSDEPEPDIACTHDYEPRSDDESVISLYASDWPVFPPAPPEELLKDPKASWAAIQARKFGTPRDQLEDSPLFALYRLYEMVVLDKRFMYRNMLEWFWKEAAWKICDIPDPKDDNPSRYAFLAGVTCLMVRSFNARIKLGLVRKKRGIMMEEEIEEALNRPEEQKPYERVPEWAENVSPLEHTLKIPTEDGVINESKEDSRADKDFAKLNILLWTPHIYFT